MIARLFYRRPPVLFTEHERRHPATPSPRRVVVNRMLLEGRDRVVAASQAVRQALILNEGLPPEQVAVIYNGIVPPPVTGAAWDRRSVRREIGVAADALLVLLPARFDPCQNHALAIRTLEHVVRDHPEVRLALVGEGPDRGMIEELAGQRGLGSHVLFLEPRGELSRLLIASDVVLLTGLCEGVPPVLIQALAAGRPVVAPRVGGVSEIIEDRVCGLLACPGDYGGLADHILRLGASPELREQFGRQGRKRLETLSSGASTALLYSNLYRTMLAH
jgi:glycosyltransferase involved in cell wall biosynthesis